ncbi:serine/threonine-protein phosphatase [Sphingomonas gilva]|uniref:Serine/threonine-protein phosphatase n=1 Tax=Sphingomonas gilva TaxID=2305907 RepID=A0A396RLB8_9SPHN|nr:protein phosphatase 2C domain-containing protein [Sphingomonas gilva]RHW16949.1 serine/threonine-protein phosphatase [Sphingomonas gilva]
MQPRPTLTARSAARTHVGRVRQVNEDRLFDAPESGLWAVADGMGGHVGGGAAATEAIRALCALSCPVTIDAIEAALASAHEAVHGAGDERGTTVAGLTFSGGEVTAFWIGDSRVYRLRDGRLEQLTRDHSLVQELVDSGTLTPEQAARHPHANIITRAIGIDAWTAPDSTVSEARPGDRFLICSDGLSSLVAGDAIARLLAQEPASAVDSLIAAALDEGGTDNVTVVVVAIA